MKCITITVALLFVVLAWVIKIKLSDEEVIQFDNYSLDLQYNRISTHINITNAIKSCNIIELNDIKSKQSYLSYIKKHCSLPFVQFSSDDNNNYIYHQINSNQYVFDAQYNASVNYLPTIIFLPLNRLHLKLIILFANTFDYIISIRSGGHQYNGFNTCHIKHNNNNKCILIDMSNFNNIILDIKSNSLILESGLRAKEVYTYLLNYNMFLPIGTCLGVGIGGNLQTSGVNINLLHKFGSASNYITSFEILLANGTFLNISKATNKELFSNFFIPKGSPAGFGVITKYKLNTTLFHDKYYKNSFKFSITWKFDIHVLRTILFTLFDILASNWDEFKNRKNNFSPFLLCSTAEQPIIQLTFIYVPENANETIYNTNTYSKYRINDILNIHPEYQIGLGNVSVHTKWSLQKLMNKFLPLFSSKFRKLISSMFMVLPSIYGKGDLSKLNYYSTVEGYPIHPPYKVVAYTNNMASSSKLDVEYLILNVTIRKLWINAILHETEYILSQNDNDQFDLFFHWIIFGINGPSSTSGYRVSEYNSTYILTHDYFIRYVGNEINYEKALKYMSLIERVYQQHWYDNHGKVMKKSSCCESFNNISDDISMHKYWNEYYNEDIYHHLIKLKTELDPKNIFNNRFTIPLQKH